MLSLLAVKGTRHWTQLGVTVRYHLYACSIAAAVPANQRLADMEDAAPLRYEAPSRASAARVRRPARHEQKRGEAPDVSQDEDGTKEESKHQAPHRIL